MSTNVYACPCCSAPLAFSGASGKLECAACGNSYETEVIEAMFAPDAGSDIHFDLPESASGVSEGMAAYTCKGCGAELMTEDTTTATECPYCGSPTIIPDRIESGVRPELVIPFTVTKEQAQNLFDEYFKGKRLLPNIFLNSRNRIAEMRRLYVPYWLFDCRAQANIVYDAQRDHTRCEGDWQITRTEHFIVCRSGRMAFDGIPVDGSVKLDNRITESLEPYDLSQAIPFSPSMLAGAMADHADVDAEVCQARAVERVENSISQAVRSTVTGYSLVSERRRNIRTEGGKAVPVLMPVWLITTEKDGVTYTFAINGQTGKLTCNVPADKKKSLAWGAGVFAGVFGAGTLALHLMEQLGSGTMLIAAVIALIAAFAVVGSMTAKLKQAFSRSGAEDYIRDNSFELNARSDQFLYATTTRRKIEREPQKN